MSPRQKSAVAITNSLCITAYQHKTMYLLPLFLLPLAAIAAVIPRTLSGDELTQTTDTLIFSTPLSKFLYIISFCPQSSSLDWNDAGCSNSPDEPLGFNFLPSCQRHDFACRNFKKQDWFTEEQQERIYKNFLTDLEGMCKEERTPRRERSCKRVAGFDYKTVKRLGGWILGRVWWRSSGRACWMGWREVLLFILLWLVCSKGIDIDTTRSSPSGRDIYAEVASATTTLKAL
jgi:hypothetical protein